MVDCKPLINVNPPLIIITDKHLHRVFRVCAKCLLSIIIFTHFVYKVVITTCYKCNLKILLRRH